MQHPNLTDEKSDSKSCSLVQDLRASNRIVECIHPEVANPYTLINQIKERAGRVYSLDLKDAFLTGLVK